MQIRVLKNYECLWPVEIRIMAPFSTQNAAAPLGALKLPCASGPRSGPAMTTTHQRRYIPVTNFRYSRSIFLWFSKPPSFKLRSKKGKLEIKSNC